MSTATNRDQLLKLLTLLRPALSTQSYIPANQHFQFKDGWCTAWNDVTSMSARCGVELEACVPGELLLRTLSSFNAENVLVQEGKDSTLVVTSGRSKIKIPTMAVDKFTYEPPSGKPETVALTDSILAGIRRCLPCVGNDPTHPAQMGVTLEAGSDGRAVLYSTDNFTISRYQTDSKVKMPGDAPIILPTFFCEQLLSLAKTYADDDLDLLLYAGAMVVKIGKKAVLMSRQAVDLEPVDFSRFIEKVVKDVADLKKALSPIPPQFDAAFSRAVLVLSSEDDKSTSVEVDKEQITLHSQSASGVSDDEIEWTGKASKEFNIDPGLVTRGLKSCGSLAFFPRALVLADDDAGFIHLIAHSK